MSKISEKLAALKKPSTEKKEWPVCPEYDGVAAIVDATEPKTYKTEFGDKEKFRFLIELNLKNGEEGNWVISSQPFTMSLHEKSSLTKWCRLFGVDTQRDDFQTDQLQNKFVRVKVEHVQGEVDGVPKVYANITYIGKAKDVNDKFETTYQSKEKKS